MTEPPPPEAAFLAQLIGDLLAMRQGQTHPPCNNSKKGAAISNALKFDRRV